MILALENDRYTRRQLRMIIRPLSEEFIYGSPESVSSDCYRLEIYHPQSVYKGNRKGEKYDIDNNN